jgi:hypothetical protein
LAFSSHAPEAHKLKPTLTLFFLGCKGAKYPHTQTQTHSIFLGVSLSTNALLWPFLHMLQMRTGSLTDSFF